MYVVPNLWFLGSYLKLADGSSRTCKIYNKFFIKFKTLNFVFKYIPYCLFKFGFLKLHEPIPCQTEDFDKKYMREFNRQLTTLREIMSYSSSENLNVCCISKKHFK